MIFCAHDYINNIEHTSPQTYSAQNIKRIFHAQRLTQPLTYNISYTTFHGYLTPSHNVSHTISSHTFHTGNFSHKITFTSCTQHRAHAHISYTTSYIRTHTHTHTQSFLLTAYHTQRLTHNISNTTFLSMSWCYHRTSTSRYCCDLLSDIKWLLVVGRRT